jgi:hypothetical protein
MQKLKLSFKPQVIPVAWHICAHCTPAFSHFSVALTKYLQRLVTMHIIFYELTDMCVMYR